MAGVRKIFIEDPEHFEIVRENFRNGTLIVDDARTIFGSRDKSLRRLCMRRRQKNCDIFFIIQGLSEVPPSISTYLTDVILFLTLDEKDRWTIDNPDKYVEVVERVNKIANSTNPYHKERIMLRDIQLPDGKRRQLCTIFAGTNGVGKTKFVWDITVQVSKAKPVLFVLCDDEESLLWDVEEIKTVEEIRQFSKI